MASRILGSMDIQSFQQKAQDIIQSSDLTESQVKKIENKIKSGKFDFEMFEEQLGYLKKAGNIQNMASFLPGFANAQTGQVNTQV
jgi:signal recognition particle subunit SRP54